MAKPNRLARGRSEFALALGLRRLAEGTANPSRTTLERHELLALHSSWRRNPIRLELCLRRRANPVRRPRRRIDDTNIHRSQAVLGERSAHVVFDLAHCRTTGIGRRDGYFDALVRRGNIAHDAKLDDAHRWYFGILDLVEDREELVAARDSARYHDAPG